ncbi:putative DD41D transposase [Trichonephila clavipes]|nr:putative DD41D transposase [Trichonephila clavipes]
MINSRTRLHVVANVTMTGQRHIDEVLLPHVRIFRGAVGDKFVFMDDNATCHRTLAVQDCLDSEGIQRLVWSARSPDLNPIENVWDALGRQVTGRNYPPTNKNTLIRALTEEWDKLPQQLLDNFVQSDLVKQHIEAATLGNLIRTAVTVTRRKIKPNVFVVTNLDAPPSTETQRCLTLFLQLPELLLLWLVQPKTYVSGFHVQSSHVGSGGGWRSQLRYRPSHMTMAQIREYENPVNGTVVTHVGTHVACGPRIIDTADTAVATPLCKLQRIDHVYHYQSERHCQVIYTQFGLAIHQNDHQARRRFVEWAQNEIAVVPDFHKRILFSDEVHFWLNGYVNKQNCRIWNEANPQVYVETPLHPEKLTVWCALWAGGIIGPYFFKNDEGHNVTVNGDRYRAMITNFFIPELNNHDVQELWFQQDGATCHTARATIDLLKDTFGDRLISRFGPVNWPPRSCDLTPLDYFLWGYVKSLVYADKPQTLDHLKDNIHRVIADIRPQMLEKVFENWTSRLDYIRASRGSHIPEIIFKM